MGINLAGLLYPGNRNIGIGNTPLGTTSFGKSGSFNTWAMRPVGDRVKLMLAMQRT